MRRFIALSLDKVQGLKYSMDANQKSEILYSRKNLSTTNCHINRYIDMHLPLEEQEYFSSLSKILNC